MSRAIAGAVSLAVALSLLFAATWMLPTLAGDRVALLAYVAISVIAFVDLVDVLIRLGVANRAAKHLPSSIVLRHEELPAAEMKARIQPWALIVSVHNLGAESEAFIEAMAPYRENLWIIDDASSDDTFSRLRQAGVHCVRADVNRKKPGALRELMQHLPPSVATVGVLDPDVHFRNTSRSQLSDMERAIFLFQQSGCAAMCPRIEVRKEGWFTRLQGLEFALTFAVGRKSLADRCVTSGVAFYRRDALQRVLERHGLSVYAEDLRNALLLLGEGEQIYYDERLVADTSGKPTIRSWFSQRVAWFFGLVRVYHDCIRDIRRIAGRRPFFIYHFVIYTAVWGILLHPLKLVALALSIAGLANLLDGAAGTQVIPDSAWTNPTWFVLAWLQSTLLTAYLLAFHVRGEKRQFVASVPLFYLYGLLHVAPITLGYANWLSLRFLRRRLYRDHFQDEPSIVREFKLQFGAPHASGRKP